MKQLLDVCPSPRKDSLTRSHTMRLEKSDGKREVWQCVTCGFTRVESRRARCRQCAGFKHEVQPFWCQSGEHDV